MGSLGTEASCCVACLSDAGRVLLMTGSLANGAFSSLQQDGYFGSLRSHVVTIR